MHKQKRILQHFQKLDHLQLNNEIYRSSLHAFCEWQLKNDNVSSDLTTELLITHVDKENVTAIVTPRADIVVAGIAEICYLLDTFTDITYSDVAADGDYIHKGEPVLIVQGNLAEVLSTERTLLNILQRLSGIATTTHHLVEKVKEDTVENPPYIAATRKTQWSMLDKKAVALGGGLTHRLSLADGILIKDNHLQMLRKKFDLQTEYDAVDKAFSLLQNKSIESLIEIEIEEEKTLEQLLSLHTKSLQDRTVGILLDNFSPKQVSTMLASLAKKHSVQDIIFEASGGITEQNLQHWANAGVDILSLGALTHSTTAADISLDIQ